MYDRFGIDPPYSDDPSPWRKPHTHETKNNKAPAEIGVIRPRPGLAYDCKTMN